MSEQSKREVIRRVRLVLNTAVAAGEIDGPDALAVAMHIVTVMLAQVRDPVQRTEFVVTLVQALPQMVEVVHVTGNPRVVEAWFSGRPS